MRSHTNPIAHKLIKPVFQEPISFNIIRLRHSLFLFTSEGTQPLTSLCLVVLIFPGLRTLPSLIAVRTVNLVLLLAPTAAAAADFGVDEPEDVCEDVTDVRQTQQHERNAENGVRDAH